MSLIKWWKEYSANVQKLHDEEMNKLFPPPKQHEDEVYSQEFKWELIIEREDYSFGFLSIHRTPVKYTKRWKTVNHANGELRLMIEVVKEKDNGVMYVEWIDSEVLEVRAVPNETINVCGECK